MRDAFGGLTNMVIIVVFLVLVSGYLAFNVNYTKAFRVKNKIISTLEEYEGECDIVDGDACHEIIKKYMLTLGYEQEDIVLTNEEKKEGNWECGNKSGYCIREIPITNNNEADVNDTKKKSYFKVITQINVDIPIIEKILPHLKFLRIKGDTKPIIMK